MMKTANGETEAMEFFLSNSSGELLCVRDDGEERVVDCYPDAVQFFNEED